MHEQQLRLATAAAGPAAAAVPASSSRSQGQLQQGRGGPAGPPPSQPPPPPPPSGLKAALSASPSQQIKITRTASGGVEFTPVTVDGSGVTVSAKPPGPTPPAA